MTAIEGDDYPRQIVTIPFPPGVPTASGTIDITNDKIVESPTEETFVVKLVSPEQGTLTGITEAEITIEDDDSKNLRIKESTSSQLQVQLDCCIQINFVEYSSI